MPESKSYHHGNLRAALLVAAEAELAENGIEALSLRKVAKRAGVSHAAPAYHFGDARGLLTALAIEGCRRLSNAQSLREAAALADPKSQLLAAGLAYVDFALQAPTLFRLMFASYRPDYSNAELNAGREAAYSRLQRQALATGAQDDGVAGIWAVAHGVADLLVSGRLQHFLDMTGPERDAQLAKMFLRNIPMASGAAA